MNIHGKFPGVRMRRMRRDDFSRRLMRENVLTTDDLIYPVSLSTAKAARKQSPRCQASSAIRSTSCCRSRSSAWSWAFPRWRCFPAIDAEAEDADGREATNPEGLVPRAVAALKKRFPELGVMTDVALDPYTTHGQDGVIDESGYILNDETLAILVKQALASGRSGRRHRRALRHDGWPHRRDPRGARESGPHPHADHGVLGEIRVGLLRTVPRRGRLGEVSRQGRQEDLPDGSGELATKRCGKSGSISPKAPTW